MDKFNILKNIVQKWSNDTSKFVQDNSKEFYLKEKDKFNKTGSKAYEGIQYFKKNMYDGINSYKDGVAKNVSSGVNSYKEGIHSNINHAKRSTYEALKYTLKQTPRVGAQLGWYGGKFGWFLTNAFLNKTKYGRYLKIAGALAVVGRTSYVYGTYFEEDMIIRKTFHRIGENESDGVNAYMISDDKSRIYGVRNSTWYGQWWSTELWTSLLENKQYHVSGYGIRIAMLGIYPNIVHAKIISDEEGNNKSDIHPKKTAFFRRLLPHAQKSTYNLH